MEELGDAEKYSFGIFYNNVRVMVERMPGNPRLITMMQVYDVVNNKSATVDLLEPLFEENHEGKRSVCTRLVEMAGRTRQNADYRIEKNGSATFSSRKENYCMSQFSNQQQSSGDVGNLEDLITKKSSAFKEGFESPVPKMESGASSLLPSYSTPAAVITPEKDEGETDGEMEAPVVFSSYKGKEAPPAAKKPKNVPAKAKMKASLPYAGKKQA